jgi:hypothetical protein
LWIIYRSVTNIKIARREFTENFAEELREDYLQVRPKKRAAVEDFEGDISAAEPPEPLLK